MTASAPASSFALDFNASASSVRAALGAVRQHLAESGCDDDSCGTVEVVLAEILNNIVEHAYADTCAGVVKLEMRPGQDRLHFRLCDGGKPLPGLSLPSARLPRRDVPTQDLPEGGFGWYLIHRLTAALTYSRESGENRLSFEIETTPADKA